jgi:hypothetical protein
MESSTKGAGNAKAKQNGGSAWGNSQAHGRFSVAGGIHHPSSVPGAGTVKANRSVGRGKQKQVGALYNWEKEQDGGDHGGGCSLDSPGSSSAGIQDMVANLQQAATNEPGHYVVSNQDNSQYDQNPVSRGIFDLQVGDNPYNAGRVSVCLCMRGALPIYFICACVIYTESGIVALYACFVLCRYC